MAQLIFNEEALINNNLMKMEARLVHQMNRHYEGSSILTTYYQIHESAVTVDRGLQDIEALFGRKSPLRFNRIDNFPLQGFGQANPNNVEENQVEDISVEGDCYIQPSTIVPNPNDFFILNHLRMNGVFQVIEVQYDSMKVEGFYKIRYRLQGTSSQLLENIEKQTIAHYRCELNALGTDLNPIIKLEDSVRRNQITRMIAGMIEDYRSMFYNTRHNCFLFQNGNERWFDLCGNEFIAKHSIMNMPNATNIIMLHGKLNEPKLTMMYQRSIYRWLEDDASLSLLNRFHYTFKNSYNYRDSTFAKWSESNINVLLPYIGPELLDENSKPSYFNSDQINFFNEAHTLSNNEYDRLIKLYIEGTLNNIHQVSLNTGNPGIAGISDIQTYLFTPIIIFIIRKVLMFN